MNDQLEAARKTSHGGVKCHVCGSLAIPQMAVDGPRFPRDTGTRHFCSESCFWKWVQESWRRREYTAEWT